MKRLTYVLAASSALALAACGKKPDAIADPVVTKPSIGDVVWTADPALTPEEKNNVHKVLVKALEASAKGLADQTTDWDHAVAAEEQKVDYVHCVTDDGQPVDPEYCHLATEKYDPVRWLRILKIPKTPDFVAYIRSEKNPTQFMFCENLKLSATNGPSYIEGFCSFRPHEEHGRHWVEFTAVKSSQSGKYDSIKFGFRDVKTNPDGSVQVHNGDAHGGDD